MGLDICRLFYPNGLYSCRSDFFRAHGTETMHGCNMSETRCRRMSKFSKTAKESAEFDMCTSRSGTMTLWHLMLLAVAMSGVHASYLSNIQYKGDSCNTASSPIQLGYSAMDTCSGDFGCTSLYSSPDNYKVYMKAFCNGTAGLTVPPMTVTSTYFVISRHSTRTCSDSPAVVAAYLADGSCIRAADTSYYKINSCGSTSTPLTICSDPLCQSCGSPSNYPMSTCLQLSTTNMRFTCLTVRITLLRPHS